MFPPAGLTPSTSRALLPVVDDRRAVAIGIIGAGRLGASLAAGLAGSGYRVTAIASTRPGSARALATAIGRGAEPMSDPARVAAVSDVVLLTVPDSAIAPLAASVPWGTRHSVIHCSGAIGLQALSGAADRGATTGCFHPLQSFPSRAPEPERFRGVFCGVEGREPLGGWLEAVAKDLGATAFRLEGVDRALYHAAAVAANNLVVALASAATRLWALAGLPEDSGREALSPLLLAAASNVATRELAEALTGPVARGDVATVERHLAALAAHPDLRDLYRRLSNELLRLPLGHTPPTTAHLREVLAAED